MMLNVWLVGQRSRPAQYADWYTPNAADHPAKTPPDLAARIATTYFRPGQRVLDPMCGIGTVLVEAAKAGLDAVGVELEEHFCSVAQVHIAEAAIKTGRRLEVAQGDARQLPPALAQYDGVIIDPPYGEIRQDGGRHKWGKRGALGNYSGEERVKRNGRRPDNVGNLKYPQYLEQMRQVYAGCLVATKHGGIMAVVVKNYRKDEQEVDLRGDTIRTAQAAGWRYHQAIVAITSPVDVTDEGPVIKPVVSATQRRNAKYQTEKEAIPQALPVYLDVLVFKRARAKEATVSA